MLRTLYIVLDYCLKQDGLKPKYVPCSICDVIKRLYQLIFLSSVGMYELYRSLQMKIGKTS